MVKEKQVLTSYIGIPVNAVKCDERFFVIYHRELQNIANIRNVSYKFGQPVILPTADRGLLIIVSCEAKDPVTHRTVSAVGEADYKNLYSGIEKSFPGEVAANRAFDRAMIQMLGFQERVYSTSEMPNLTSMTQPNIVPSDPSSFFEAVQTNNPDEVSFQDSPSQTGQVKEAASGQTTANATPNQQAVPNQAAYMRQNTGRPPMPQGLPDTILIGSLRTKSYAQNKDTPKMTTLIKFVKEHPEVVYPEEAMNQQAAFFRTLN